MEKNLDITKPRYSEQNFPVPWYLVLSGLHCNWVISYRLDDLDLWPMRVKTMETAMIVYFDFLLLSVCVWFSKKLCQKWRSQILVKEKTNTVGNNEQRKWIVIKATTFLQFMEKFCSLIKTMLWMTKGSGWLAKIWLGIFLCKYTTLLLKASDDVKMSQILRWTHSPSICFLRACLHGGGGPQVGEVTPIM